MFLKMRIVTSLPDNIFNLDDIFKLTQLLFLYILDLLLNIGFKFCVEI